MSEMAKYYAERAQEYERIYAKPERQVELEALRELSARYFSGLTVVELACGTGYWTAAIAPTCKSVVGIDINQEVLDIAAMKPYARDKVQFVCADLYQQPDLPGPFDGALAAHWWSHVDVRETARFLEVFHQSLQSGCKIMLLDNMFAPGSSTPISRSDAHGNSYQQRVLDDGTRYEVLKNFPTAAIFARLLDGIATQVQFTPLQYYWHLSYTLN
jgi:SAM-dependent methyltransferase